MPPREDPQIEHKLSALYQEYRAMYDLVIFRMTALDRRAPVTVGAFAAALASLQVLPTESQGILLVLLPIANVWLIRTTINHARSFEDVLRRIEWIEQSVNQLVGSPVLGFQLLHPSRHRRVGGRTGYESVLAVLGSVHLLLAAAAYQLYRLLHLSLWANLLFLLYLLVISALSLAETKKLMNYRYSASIDTA
jgi:hypothetical protein